MAPPILATVALLKEDSALGPSCLEALRWEAWKDGLGEVKTHPLTSKLGVRWAQAGGQREQEDCFTAPLEVAALRVLGQELVEGGIIVDVAFRVESAVCRRCGFPCVKIQNIRVKKKRTGVSASDGPGSKSTSDGSVSMLSKPRHRCCGIL